MQESWPVKLRPSKYVPPKQPMQCFSLESYQVISKLGQGSYGDIYLVSKEDQYFACKSEVVEKSKQSTLQMQAFILKKLEHKPGFPRLIELIKQTDRNFLITEVLGPNLEDIKQRQKDRRLNPHSVAVVGLCIFRALKNLHQLGFIHRDIKPQNILIARTHQVRLIDLGLAVQLKAGLNRSKALIGNAKFAGLSAHKGEFTQLTDFQSLGYVMLYLVQGKLAWQSEEEVGLSQMQTLWNDIGRKKQSQVQLWLQQQSPSDWWTTFKDYFKAVRKGKGVKELQGLLLRLEGLQTGSLQWCDSSCHHMVMSRWPLLPM